MKSFFNDKILKFYTKETELDVILFKILGTAGFTISIVGAIQSFFTAADYISSLVNLAAAFASVCLMLFVDKTKKYVVGYLITSVSIFMILFGMLFMEMGGLYGSMPYFFMFGIVFTLLMYKGKLLYLMEFLQISFYVGICLFSFLHPEYVKSFNTPEDMFADQLAGILFSSIGIGVIFQMYIREYRKQQKLAAESSNAKSILLANISHEIRTPINMLLGMNEMIIRESENSQITEYAQNVDSAGRQLLFMVNQFLDLSRIDMGKEEMFEENFNLPELVDGLDSFFKKEAGVKNIEFVLDKDKDLPVYLFGDARKITQILNNLLSNAVKYTSEGIIVFTIKKLSEEGDSCRIHFEVSDTGAGISQEDQKKIFESFERADIIRNRGIEGTGLGLAISSNLANLMGTVIEVKSRYGEGSLFWFDLDLKKGAEPENSEISNETFIAPEAVVLAVDDNSMNLRVLKSLLKRTMIKLDLAQSARECYEKYEKKEYDLVFMDYMMPDIDGIEAMEELRQIDILRSRYTPIVVLTADATPEMKKVFMKKGFDDYLLKPLNSALLEKTLIKRLPEKLVTIVEEQAQIELPAEMKERFSDILRKYDMSMDLAMKHLSGDILQMVRVAEYFIKSAEENMEKLVGSIKSKDFATAALLFHSVKGNSGNVGGEELYYSARRLEKRAKDGDADYVESALPLFVMEWKRVKEGLLIFLEEFEKVRPTLDIVYEEKEINLDEQELWDKLLEAVRLGNGTPAIKYADELVRKKGDTELLSEIRRCIKNIDFDRAEELINQR